MFKFQVGDVVDCYGLYLGRIKCVCIGKKICKKLGDSNRLCIKRFDGVRGGGCHYWWIIKCVYLGNSYIKKISKLERILLYE